MKKRLITLLLVFCMLFSFVPTTVFAAEEKTPSVELENPFTDVKETDWFYKGVQYARMNGFFGGTSATTLDPDGTMTRGMFVTVLGRMAGVDAKNYKGQAVFADVSVNQYYAPYVAWAAKHGITNGTGGGNFSPDAFINRQQMATFFVNYFEAFGIDYGTENNTAAAPADLDSAAEWAKASILKLWNRGLLVGDGTNFDPHDNATRAQAATLATRMDEVVETWYKEPGVPSKRVKIDPTTGLPFETQPVVPSYTVIFRDYDGTVLKTQTVEKGKAASAPANPSREGFTFAGWDNAFHNVTADLVVTAMYKFVPSIAIVTYTVTFLDHDGTVLKRQEVVKDNAATAPATPSREHFTFAGWDKSFDRVTSDLVVTATYTTSKTVISAESVTVSKGTNEVTVNIRVYNNPGIMGAVLKVSVDDRMFTFKSGSKNQYPGLTLTSPGSGVTASPYTFLLDSMELGADDKKDGTLFSVTFKVDNLSATGTYDVKPSYNRGAVFDENYNDIDAALEHGTITIN